jgi:curved DNA-binding protein
MTRDYYGVLGVSPSASGEEIKRAYRRLAMELHPDRNPGDPQGEERFKAINEAYAVLGDPRKRTAYERLRLSHQPPDANDDLLRGFDFSSLFREFGLRSDEEIRERFFCPGRRARCGRRKRFFERSFAETSWGRPGKAVHDLPLSPIEALTGTEREVWVQNSLGPKRYVIHVPSGVTAGTIIRLPIGEPEELYLRVRVTPVE